MTDHVYIRHMQGAPRDCSMFKSNDVEEVNDIINETVNYPDKIKAHRSDINRIVYIKKFKKSSWPSRTNKERMQKSISNL